MLPDLLAFGLLAELFLLILDEPTDHLPPQRLGELGRQALLTGPRPDLVDHLLDAPRHARLCRRSLQLPGSIDIGEALADEIDQLPVDAVDLGPYLVHVAAVFRLAWRHHDSPLKLRRPRRRPRSRPASLD